MVLLFLLQILVVASPKGFGGAFINGLKQFSLPKKYLKQSFYM